MPGGAGGLRRYVQLSYVVDSGSREVVAHYELTARKGKNKLVWWWWLIELGRVFPQKRGV